MRTDKQVFRWLATRLPSASERGLVVLTGARQTGKTTLAKDRYAKKVRYVNLDAMEDREALRAVRTSSWAQTVGNAVIRACSKSRFGSGGFSLRGDGPGGCTQV